MRPDEHKKKKNEQYKKKHGIKNAKEKVVKSQGADKPPQGPQTSGHPRTQKIDTKKLSDDEELDIQRQFSRRKVESNWHRYEAEEQDPGRGESQGLTGADFQQLLSHKASSLSQFRFKEEQLWDPGELKQPPQLSLDCDDLLSTVVCVPLHQRLDIETLHFEKCTLDKFEESANRSKQMYEAKHTQEEEKPECSNITRNKDNLSDTKECTAAKNSDEELEQIISDKTPESCAMISTEKSPQNVQVVDNSTTDTTKENLVREENHDLQDTERETDIADDLDELLGICDNSGSTQSTLNSVDIQKDINLPSESAVLESVVTDTHKTKEVVENLEDQLDELLNLDQTSSKVFTPDKKDQVTKSTASAGGDKTDGASSLEDWLDDMLDD